MNVAFSTLILLVLLSPGFICRYAFLKGPYSRKNFKPSVSDDIFWSVIPAFVLQFSAFGIVRSMNTSLSLENLYFLIIGSENVSFSRLNGQIGDFLLYSIALMLFGYLVGAAARWTVIKFNLDLKYNILKVNNEWYYLFSGKLTNEKVEAIQVDVLVKSEKGTSLYSGILEDYFLNADGGIDRLYMLEVSRDMKYQMPGDYFVVFGKEILNLNLTYFNLSEAS